MSILIRVLPFWISGILAGWALPSIVFIPPIWPVSLWAILVLICVYSGSRPDEAFPKISLGILLLVFLSSFQMTLIRSACTGLPVGEKIGISGRILKVWEGPGYHRFKLLVISYDEGKKTHNCREPVLLQSGRFDGQAPSYGDYLSTETKVETIQKKAKPDDFPERLYWAGEGIRKKGWLRESETRVLPSRKCFHPLLAAGKLQELLCNRLDSCTLGQDQSALIKAILLGRKDYLSTGVKDVFQQTGISHLLAVSGLHAGLVYMIFSSLFFHLKGRWRRFIVEGLAVTAVWGYSLITGFGPSVQRAAGMISLFALSRMFNRRVEPLQVLVIAFFLQTAVNPLAIFRLGFQLSYLAVAGIFIIYRSWTRLIRIPVKILRRIWDFAGVSIAAQSLTLPFILVYFHEFPSYFLLGNLVLVPLGLMIFYFSAGYLTILALGISIPLVEKFLELLIRLMLSIGEGIASFPNAVIGFESFSPLHMLGYYILLSTLFLNKGISRYKRFCRALSLALLFSVLGIFLSL